MTREYREYAKSRIEYLLKISSFVFDEHDREALEVAIQALSQVPCDDAISRDAVIEATHHCGDLQEVRGVVQQLPPVTQKSGKWRPVYQGDEIINYRCSECELGDTNGSTNLYGWDYCRRCGARMEK